MIFNHIMVDGAPTTYFKYLLFRTNKGYEYFFNCPCLEEVQLQDNRLEYIPPALFSSLKVLASLDLSNNKLQVMVGPIKQLFD
jgi:hypothetical protein